eukprot:IDg6377t1
MAAAMQQKFRGSEALWSAAHLQYAQAVGGQLLTEAAHRARLCGVARAVSRAKSDMRDCKTHTTNKVDRGGDFSEGSALCRPLFGCRPRQTAFFYRLVCPGELVDNDYLCLLSLEDPEWD